MRRFLFLIVVLVVALPVGTIAAQDGSELACEPDAMQSAIAEALARLEAGQSLEGMDALEAIKTSRAALAAIESTCNGWTIRGEGGKVFGPVELPAGYYRVTATGEGMSLFVEGTLIEGQCGDGYGDSFSLFMYMNTEFLNPPPFNEEALLSSEGCTVLWEVSQVHGPFEITFEQLR